MMGGGDSEFGVLDYIVFGLTLGISTLIGIYYGCFGTRQRTGKEYLYGKGNMKAIPIGLSLYSSAVSSITILGNPSEMYYYGTQFAMMNIGVILSLILTWNFILPVFCGNLKITTPYEYIELRFNYKVRIMSTLIYIFHTMLILPIILYGSILGFSVNSGISVTTCTTVVGGLCVLYTMLGGFSAVIWSDAFQATLMVVACLFIMIKGLFDMGGISEIWHIAEDGNRIKFFDINPNPFQRLSLWSTVIGMMFTHTGHNGCTASSLQRYMALKNERQAKISTLISVVTTVVMGSITAVIGLSMYALYANCDPMKNHEIDDVNKLIPKYVSHILKDIPGLTGVFNAGLLCAGLSTISAELNTVSGLTYHCLVKRIYGRPLNEVNGAIIMKIIVVIYGLYYLAISPFFANSKHIFPLALSIAGITYGTKIGILLLGTTFPKTNSWGAFCGIITSICIISWINIGASVNNVSKSYILPTSVANCSQPNNITSLFNTTQLFTDIRQAEEPFFLYKLSYMYYAFLGTIITLLVSFIVSYATGLNDVSKMDQDLFIPCVRDQHQIIQLTETNIMLADKTDKESLKTKV